MADRKLQRNVDLFRLTKYKQVKCVPPESLDLKGITVYYFFKGKAVIR